MTEGKGGDVIFLVDKGINTLTDYRHRRKFAAEDRRAAKRTATERMVRILYLRWQGTLIKDAASGKVIADMSVTIQGRLSCAEEKAVRATSTMPHPPCRRLNMLGTRDRMQ